MEEQVNEVNATTETVNEQPASEQPAKPKKSSKKSAKPAVKKSAKPAKKTAKQPAKKATPKKSAKPAKKTAKKSAEKKERTPRAGVLDAIHEMLKRKEGVTFEEGVKELVKKFPQRDPKQMAVTFRCQMTKLPKSRSFNLKKTKVEGRKGLVYKAA